MVYGKLVARVHTEEEIRTLACKTHVAVFVGHICGHLFILSARTPYYIWDVKL